MELTPTIVNVAVFGIITLSAILAYARGLTREAVTLAVWIGAALLALRFYPVAVPYVEELANLDEFTRWAAVGAAFVVALIVLTLLGSLLSGIIANSPLRSIDKGLGFLFGAARGLLLLAVGWLGYQELMSDERTTATVEAAQGGRLVRDASLWLERQLPEEWPPFLSAAVEDLVGDEPEPLPESVPAPADPTES